MTPPRSDAPVRNRVHRIEQQVHRRALPLLNISETEREQQVHVMLANRQRGVVVLTVRSVLMALPGSRT